MNCEYTIRIVERNDFTLVLPLKRRTYVANKPIDEDIDIMALEDCKVLIGDREFAHTLDPSGVQVHFVDDDLQIGTYDIVLTATYHGAKIRAAYFEGLQRVSWNKDANAQQYIAGSPIVAQAAYVIGGALTDAELELLKAEYREKIAASEQAEQEAEQAKAEWECKAEQLDDVASETKATENKQAVLGAIDTLKTALQGDNAQATLTAILAAFGTIDFSTLAKEQTLTNGIQSILTALNPKATTADVTAAKQAILDALSHIAPEDPNSKALAEFFGVTLLQGYEFMTDTEVTDELEDIMQALDPELLQEVEYPEGSGQMITKAQFITIQAMEEVNNIINPSES